jgi:hypothetical protein
MGRPRFARTASLYRCDPGQEVANAHFGRRDEARADLGRMPAIDSKLTIAEWRAFAAPLFAPEFLELYVTGMRLAGLPEG